MLPALGKALAGGLGKLGSALHSTSSPNLLGGHGSSGQRQPSGGSSSNGSASRPVHPPLPVPYPTIPPAGQRPTSGPHSRMPAPPAPAPAPAVPAAPVQPRRQLFSDPSACAGCGKGFLLSSSYMTAMGRKWHPGCFRCGLCEEPIGDTNGGQFLQGDGDPLPYHPDCYRVAHGITCTLCGNLIAPGPDGRTHFKESGFWRQRYCHNHTEQQAVRCGGCSRIKPHNEEWATLADSRQLCLPCVSSVVVDTPDAQPLYDEVLRFFREMALPHPVRAPLMLVDGGTLAEYSSREGRVEGAGAPVFHVRGLCVAQVYSSIPTVLRTLGAGLGVRSVSTPVKAANPSLDTAPAPGQARCNVTAVLVLYGLPRLLTGSILAHELMHAWLRMAGVVGLRLKVEEGLCQLMACLWLDKQHDLLQGDLEQQRLASYLSYQIRNDTSEVYGDGFREALEAFQQLGLSRTVLNVATKGSFYG